jgi:hypothetical protein
VINKETRKVRRLHNGKTLMIYADIAASLAENHYEVNMTVSFPRLASEADVGKY